MSKLVYLEDSLLTRMAERDDVVREFPFLKSLKRVKRQGRCCNSADRTRTQSFQAARRTIAGLSDDRKRRLKELLKADRIRVRYRNSRQDVVKLTF